MTYILYLWAALLAENIIKQFALSGEVALASLLCFSSQPRRPTSCWIIALFLSSSDLSAFVPLSFISSQGVIRDVPLDVSDHELLENLEVLGCLRGKISVMNVRRLNKQCVGLVAQQTIKKKIPALMKIALPSVLIAEDLIYQIQKTVLNSDSRMCSELMPLEIG